MLKKTILIVDDEKINRRILSKLLQNEYTILEATDGKEALLLLRTNIERISAVLLDIVMPGMDGYEVLNCMKHEPELSKIPVIVSSQKDGDEAELKALSLGAQDFIAKPYKAELIRCRLSNLIKFRETASLLNKVERDELTGLYNKLFFLRHVSEELSQHPEVCYDLICVGIERFRLINEAYGMTKGDELLKYIATLIKSSQIPVCATRFSADVFLILVPHNGWHESALRAFYKRINEFPIDMDIKLHCGIYEIKDTKLSVSAMCDRAHLASEKNKGMYESLFFLYDNSLHQKMLDEQFVTSQMRFALEKGQYQVYYQPKYDLSNECIAGAEALVRWIHPQKGFLSPGLFIPIFERNGFISELDQYVWECVCRDMRYWLDKGLPPVAVSVNISRADVYNPKLSNILLNLLEKYKIPVQFLHLEITESAYTDNSEQIILEVGKLRKLGFIVEMDDFGSGYSSLNMLAEMPVDVLKLDMHFIQNETRRASGRGILSFVISLAKWLDLAVVAEGVETSEQIATLRSMDCNYVQGFYYAKPMQRCEFELLLTSSKITEMICTSQTDHQYIPQKEEDKIPLDGRKMLIVDDIELNRAVLVSCFEKTYTIVEKENGREALDYLNEHYADVDIVMLDLLMPVMDGFQLLDRIRSDSRMQGISVIVTSQGDVSNERRALQMRADDFISKPYHPDIIRHRVHNVLTNYQLKKFKESIQGASADSSTASSPSEQAFALIKILKPHFDIVRLVEPKDMLVYLKNTIEDCETHACYTIWGNTSRCINCISLKALKEKSKHCKLEYTRDGLYFVIAEYIPFLDTGAVIEMVTKLDDNYIDNVFEKNMLYANINVINKQLDYDALTGVYNRRHIDKYLSKYVDAAKKGGQDIGIAMIDIDMFKQLNDTNGHLIGDDILKKVAKILEKNISVNRGDFVARFGGDEFLIVCLAVEPHILKRRVEVMVELVRGITIEGTNTAKPSISGGCVCLSEYPNMTGMELIAQADKRLYEAKKSGAGTVSSSL